MKGPGLPSLNLICCCRRGFDSRDAQTGLTLATKRSLLLFLLLKILPLLHSSFLTVLLPPSLSISVGLSPISETITNIPLPIYHQQLNSMDAGYFISSERRSGASGGSGRRRMRVE
ncbi:unnamed protein product [Pleuronectes platessa]|uniref:Uncharacterized protein n=1 Tax=Pleuronectes platessa TaxID=8262 RepID=A0A9N7UGH9_PLEPL|nr:unnamed protein product [Pleuronectes platessa]